MLEKENNLPAISEFTDFLDEILSEVALSIISLNLTIFRLVLLIKN